MCGCLPFCGVKLDQWVLDCQFDPFFIKLEATDGHCSDSLISLGIAKW